MKIPRPEPGTVGVVSVLVVLILVLAYFHAARVMEDDSKVVKVICAGSLMYTLGEVEERFEKENPGLDMRVEGHGSIQVIRQVTDLGRSADIVMVADRSLIPEMMYGEGGRESFADWEVSFASNEVVLAYKPELSKYADEMNGDNWYEILLRDDVRFGFSNPAIDACGYRVLMLTQLAELHYGEPYLFEDLIGASFDPAIRCAFEDGNYTITVPEIVNPNSDRLFMRASSIQLLGLLDLGEVDYIFEYTSVARQHGCGIIELPPQINLGNESFESSYGKMLVEYKSSRFVEITPIRRGQTILYGLTIPTNAENPEGAVSLLDFLLGESGRDLFLSAHHPMLNPYVVDNPSALPEELERYV